MNTKFISLEFCDPLFVEIYTNFLSKMNSIMEEEYELRKRELAKILLECWEKSSVKQLEREKRIPWTEACKAEVQEYALTLKDIYALQSQELS